MLKKSGRILLTGLLAGIGLLPGQVSAAPTEKSYVSGSEWHSALPACRSGPIGDKGFGGVCFDASGTSVTLQIKDASGRQTPGYFQFLRYECDALGCRWVQLSIGRFCGSSSSVSVPTGAQKLEVEVGDSLGRPGCPLGAVGTSGTVIATFT